MTSNLDILVNKLKQSMPEWYEGKHQDTLYLTHHIMRILEKNPFILIELKDDGRYLSFIELLTLWDLNLDYDYNLFLDFQSFLFDNVSLD